MPRTMRHIIAIHLQNEAGALTRVTGPVFDPRLQHRVAVGSGHGRPLGIARDPYDQGRGRRDPADRQPAQQAHRRGAVEDLTRGEHIERELVVLKLRVEPQLVDSVRGYVVRAGGRVLEPSPEGFVVELTASEAEVNQFVTDLGERTDIVEVVRSGALAVGRNARALHVVR